MDQHTSSNHAHRAPAKAASPLGAGRLPGRWRHQRRRCSCRGQLQPRAELVFGNNENSKATLESPIRRCEGETCSRLTCSSRWRLLNQVAATLLPPCYHRPHKMFHEKVAFGKMGFYLEFGRMSAGYVQQCYDLLQQSFQPASAKQNKNQPRLQKQSAIASYCSVAVNHVEAITMPFKIWSHSYRAFRLNPLVFGRSKFLC